MLLVRRLGALEWRAYREVRLRALSDAPDAFGSTLEREQSRPDSHWAERLASGAASAWDLPIVAVDGERIVGLAWGKIDPSDPSTAYVLQMWVAPESRGLGCGSMLLDSILRWAREAQARRVALGVTCGNAPAWRLYGRAGFQPEGDPEPLRLGSDLLSQRMCLNL